MEEWKNGRGAKSENLKKKSRKKRPIKKAGRASFLYCSGDQAASTPTNSSTSAAMRAEGRARCAASPSRAMYSW